MTFTKDDALDLLAHVVYKRRVKCQEKWGIGGEGSREGDRLTAVTIWNFFERYHGSESIEDILMNHTYEDYKDFLPFYQFLNSMINA